MYNETRRYTQDRGKSNAGHFAFLVLLPFRNIASIPCWFGGCGVPREPRLLIPLIAKRYGRWSVGVRTSQVNTVSSVDATPAAMFNHNRVTS